MCTQPLYLTGIEAQEVENGQRYGIIQPLIYFTNTLKKALEIISSKKDEHKILFLQSWNEWGEGNYVEPDCKYGHGYLESIKKALNGE